MMLTDEKSSDTKIVLKNRMGFVRLAWENGMDLVPVFCFGEKWTCNKVNLPKFLRKILEKIRMAGTILKGRWGTLLPNTYHHKHGELSLGWVFGAPIPVAKRSCKEMNEDELKVAQEHFALLDANKDGKIDSSELNTAIRKQKAGELKISSSISIRSLSRNLKAKHKDSLDQSEFLKWCRQEKTIRELHERFMVETQRLFTTYKKQFGYPDDETLTIVDPSASDFKNK